ncbi:DUF6358 family protein [Rubrolithibacter danxiaensis]|uniref:DUF6358 family protein n=1 Tax=Rubrolithibacter danxiaensis TaxID=3390805 RepID=UPI003BF81DCA
MIKKILLNIFFNLGILTLVLCLIWLYNHQQYPLMAGVVFILALFVYLKMRLIRSVKELTRKKASAKR